VINFDVTALEAPEDQVMHRVRTNLRDGRKVSGFGAPERVRAALALEKRGILYTWWGSDKDQGVLLVALADTPPVPRSPYPRSRADRA
jgi:hypothetical protein